jgi:hypothetical protein
MFEVVRSSPICGAKFAPQWARALKKGARVCVECQQFAMHKRLGVRCKGHGALQKETRWDAVITPGRTRVILLVQCNVVALLVGHVLYC